MDFAKRPAIATKGPKAPALTLLSAGIHHFTEPQRSCIFKKEKARPSSSKDDDHFIIVVWKQTHNIFEVHLY